MAPTAPARNAGRRNGLTLLRGRAGVAGTSLAAAGSTGLGAEAGAASGSGSAAFSSALASSREGSVTGPWWVVALTPLELEDATFVEPGAEGAGLSRRLGLGWVRFALRRLSVSA